MEAGQELAQRLAAGDVLLFSVELQRGDLLRIRAEQQQVDVTMEVSDPGDHAVAREDSLSGPDGPEVLIFEAERGGVHRLRVTAIGGDGRLLLAVETAGLGTAADHALHSARRLALRAQTESLVLAQLEEAIERLPPETPPLEVARLWKALASAQKAQGRLAEASETLVRAHELIAAYGNGWELAPLLNDQTQLLLNQGRLRDAAPLLEESIRVSKAVGLDKALAVAWNNLGVWHAARGELSQSIDAYTRSEALVQDIGDTATGDFVRLNLGVDQLALGRLEDGVEILRRSAAVLRQTDRTVSLALTLASLGWGLDHTGKTAEAQAHYDEAVELLQRARASHDLAIVLEQRAAFFLGHDRAQAALGDVQRSRRVAQPDPQHEAFLDLRTGQALSGLGRPREALAPLERARSGFHELAVLHGRLAVHVAVGRALRQLGRLGEARRELEAARDLAETLRADLLVDSHRRSFLAGRHEVYVELVDLLAGMGHAEEAFEVADGARARSLLDLLTDPEEAGARHELAAELRSLHLERVLALRDGDELRAGTLARDIRERQLALELAEESRRRSAGAQRAPATPVPARDVQGHLDADTVLLAFTLGERRSWLWQLTHDEILMVERPPREEIETLARGAHQLLHSGGVGVEAATREALAALSEALFAGIDLRRRRLAIIADGALNFVPFGVLSVPDDAREHAPEMLIEGHEIVTLPSASTLVHLRRRLHERAPLPGLLAVVADPVFSSVDPRVDGPVARTAAPVWRFRRLPASAQEAQRIALLARGHEVLQRVGFDADRGVLLDGDGGRLSRFRWLHFATHALVDPRYPQQSGLVLSLVDRQGRPRDGFLRPDEIADLHLPSELVTLSACETALGPQVRGEGVVGLAHAFFTAGASRLVASLWEVKDNEITVRLMETFYRGLFEGLPPADALRRAQLELHAEGTAPAHWAAFVLLGPWDPLAPIASITPVD